MKTLDKWAVIRTATHSYAQLSGRMEGKFRTTSPVVSRKDNVVRTRSGSEYLLGSCVLDPEDARLSLDEGIAAIGGTAIGPLTVDRAPTPPPRSLTATLGQIVAILDANQYHTAADALRSVVDNAGYTAPEIMGERWADATRILNRHLPDPYSAESPEWAKQVARIFNGEEGY